MTMTDPEAGAAQSRFKTSKVLEFIGRRGNLVGSATGAIGFLGALDVVHRPLLVLAVGAAAYVGGYFLGKDYRKDVSINLNSHSERVEVHTIQRNITALQAALAPHRSRLPKTVITQLDDIFATLADILPQWSKLAAFTEQKYTVNTIVASYLPTVITNYINLPTSYYHNAKKKQVGEEVETQLGTLLTTLQHIREDIYGKMERNIEGQGIFLKNQFTSEDNDLLNL